MNHHNKIIFVFMLLSSLGVISCGDDSAITDRDYIFQENDDSPAVYRAVLLPTNTNFYSQISGSVEIRRSGDQIEILTSVVNAPGGVHRQAVYFGSSCPTLASDANIDRYVDAGEARVNTGLMLIPLDSELSAQALGFEVFPSGINYSYREVSSYDLMVSDLRLLDPNPTDQFGKLGASELSLDGKIVMIQGVSDSLPSSVGTVNGELSSLTLPIACGVLIREPVSESPTQPVDPTNTPTAGGTTGTTGGTTGI